MLEMFYYTLEIFSIKTLLKKQKYARSAYEIFYATSKQGFKRIRPILMKLLKSKKTNCRYTRKD